MANINDFIALMRDDGLARENRFEVVITPPRILNATNSEFEKLLFYCQSATLPGINFMSQAVYTFGEAREVIYNRSFDPVELEFLVDDKMEIKWFFDRWTENIIDPITRMANYYNDYTTTIEISQLDFSKNEEVKYTVALHEAYVKTLSPIQYNATSKDVTKLRATIQYKYWTVTTAPIVNRQTQLDVPDSNSTETPI